MTEQEMTETQRTLPVVDTEGEPLATMQEGTTQLPEPNPTALLQVDVSPIYLRFPPHSCY